MELPITLFCYIRLEEAQGEITRLKKNAVTTAQLDDMRAQLDHIRNGAEVLAFENCIPPFQSY